MFRPFSGEVRARHAYLETAQADLATSLANLMLIDLIGEDNCARFADLSQRLVIANVKRSGEITLPKRHDEEAIPYIATQPGEELFLSAALMGPTPSQHERMLEAVADWGDGDPLVGTVVVRKTVKELTRRPLLPESAGKNNLGFVSYACTTSGYPAGSLQWRGLFKGRPHLGLIIGKPFPEISLLHETEHVRQILDEPVVLGDDAAREESTIRGELQSYHYAALMAFVLRHAGIADLGDERFEDAVIIEAVRSQYASDDDPFKPTEKILETLRTLGMEHRVKTENA